MRIISSSINISNTVDSLSDGVILNYLQTGEFDATEVNISNKIQAGPISQSCNSDPSLC